MIRAWYIHLCEGRTIFVFAKNLIFRNVFSRWWKLGYRGSITFYHFNGGQEASNVFESPPILLMKNIFIIIMSLNDQPSSLFGFVWHDDDPINPWFNRHLPRGYTLNKMYPSIRNKYLKKPSVVNYRKFIDEFRLILLNM